MAVEGANPTRRSNRERVRTPKAAELDRKRRETRNQNGSSDDETEDTIEVVETAPAAPQPKRTEISSHLKDRVVATKIRAFSAKAGERPATTAPAPNHLANEKATAAANVQIKMFTDLTKSLLRAMEEQKEEHANQIETLMKTFTEQIESLKAEVAELIQGQLSNIQAPPSATPLYADVARTPPSSRPSNVRTLTSMDATLSTMTDTLYCTVDTSRVGEEDRIKAQPGTIRQAIEKEMRATEGHEGWRCAAVIRDARNMERIRVACRDEAELQRVKEAAQKTAAAGARVLRDQLYPVKVDNANRTAILDQEGKVLPGAAEILGKENDVRIAKLAWLSRKDTGKAYGSMVVYVTKGSEAARLLQDQYFHIAGESAYTQVFEPRYGPKQCYRCQELGHKAFSCMKPQVCAKCAQQGHHHSECQVVAPRCVPCGGPHESFSRNCRVLYPTRHE